MFDKDRFDNIPKFEEFTYWFIRTSETTFDYGDAKSFLSANPDILGGFELSYTDALQDSVRLDFEKYTNRPEFQVGERILLVETSSLSNDITTMIDFFETVLAGSIFIRALKTGKNPDSSINSVAVFLNWIRNTDFYTCPGSTRFHDAEPSGLLFHSLKVYNNMIELMKLDKFNSVNVDSIAIISLCHDFTKIGNYELYKRNVKNEDTGKWEKVDAYRWKENPFPLGHGVASMYIVTQFIRLSIEEMLAIRWHMGEYNVSPREEGELQDACEKYPLIRMIQFADQLACVTY